VRFDFFSASSVDAVGSLSMCMGGSSIGDGTGGSAMLFTLEWSKLSPSMRSKSKLASFACRLAAVASRSEPPEVSISEGS
jgi:hypothetical protein